MAGTAVGESIFLICDRTHHGVIASDAYCDLIGRRRAAVVGRLWDDWVDPTEREELGQRFEQALDGTPNNYMRRAPTADGGCVTIAGTFTPLRFGKTCYVLSSVNALFATDGLRADLCQHQAEVALYIEALAGSLANVVKAAGMTAMGDNLSGVADEAARLARQLAARFEKSG